jgi:glycosyltransferase involved in cell wall biosynthesis
MLILPHALTEPSANPRTVLHLTLASDAGGLSRYIIDLAAAMRVHGWNSVVAGDVGVWQDRFDDAGIEYIRVPLKSGLRGFLKSARIVREHLAGRPVHLLHAHYRRAVQLGRWLQRPLSRDARLQMLYTLHLSHIDVSGIRRWFSDFGDHTHCASVDAREWLVADAHVPEDRISLIPHGIDTDRFPVTTPDQRAAARRSLGLSDSDVVFCFAGRLDHPKNEEWLLDVDEAAVQAGVKHLRILLAGEGPHEAMLRQRIASEGRTGRVLVLGHRDVLPVYQASDLLCLPSEREGFSLVCAEAMSTGVPILRTRTSGTFELVVENRTGRSVPIHRSAFVAAALMLAQDRNLLRELGQGAARHVRQHFTFDKQVARTAELYAALSRGSV